MRLIDLSLGKVDGKADFSEARENSEAFQSSFLMPDNVRFEDFDSGDRYFVTGFRGTGKTSLLRYYIQRRQPRRSLRKIVLFKSHIEEDQRIDISKQVGFDFQVIEPGRLEIAQDFKSAWRWFVLHKIGEVVRANIDAVPNRVAADTFLKLLGLGNSTIVQKTLGVMPKLEGAAVKVSGDLGFFAAELSADFTAKGKEEGVVPLRALVSAAQRALLRMSFNSTIVIAFDELEAFYTDHEKFRRDLRMVRDLLFVIDDLNQSFLSSALDVYLIAGVRSEVLFAMKADGQEIERTVHDHGITLSWHHSNRSLHHPLIEMIRRRLAASGVKAAENEDILWSCFPQKVDVTPLETYLLDGSFYKPRDIVWRLTIIQEQFPNAEFFREDLFQSTANTYSQRLWSEVAYELNARYSEAEITVVKRIFSGFKKYFSFSELQDRVREVSTYGEGFRKFGASVDLSELLHDLYRLGAIGNDFPLGRSNRRASRWIFRNEPDLLLDRQMVINSALSKALTIR